MNLDTKLMYTIKQILYVAIKIGQLNPRASIDDLYSDILKEVMSIVEKEESDEE